MINQNFVSVVFILDWTCSMGEACRSLSKTLIELSFVLDILCGKKYSLNVIAYGDYCDGMERVLQARYEHVCGKEEVKTFVTRLRPYGGGDAPEACKTALNELKRVLPKLDNPLVVHYTDASPHTSITLGENYEKERRNHKVGIFDWMLLSRQFDDVPFFTIFLTDDSSIRTYPSKLVHNTSMRMYQLLGQVLPLTDKSSKAITKMTMSLILSLMGQPAEFDMLDKVYRTDLSFDKESHLDFRKFVYEGITLARARDFPKYSSRFYRDLKQIPKFYALEESFRNLSFEAMEYLIVNNVMAIVENPVFGALWRRMCTDNKSMEQLCNKMGLMCSGTSMLANDDKTTLRAFIDASYNQVDEINALVMSGRSEKVYILDVHRKEELPSRDEIKSLFHAPLSKTLKTIQLALSKLKLVDKFSSKLPPDENGCHMYIPDDLRDKDVFALLTNLMSPGLLASKKTSAFLAILVYLSRNKTLFNLSLKFLNDIRGTWIPSIEDVASSPEILNSAFFSLVVQVPDMLTVEEFNLFSLFHKMHRVRQAKTLPLTLFCGFTPTKINTIADYKRCCIKCDIRRSTSIMVGDVCGLCIFRTEDGGVSDEPDADEPEGDKSHMVQCSNCQGIYATVNPSQLRVKPKCHFCRVHQLSPCSICKNCKNKFVLPTSTDRHDNYICGHCASCASNNDKCLDTLEVPFQELAKQFPVFAETLGLNHEFQHLLFDNMSFFKVWNAAGKNMFEKGNVGEVDKSVGFWIGKEIHNFKVLLDSIEEEVYLKPLLKTCNICFEEKHISLISNSTCGNCTNSACNDCLFEWYSGNQKGCIYTQSMSLCAFCKCVPKYSVLKKFNPAVLHVPQRKTFDFQPDLIYALCKVCYKISEAGNRECGNECDLTIRDFTCEVCTSHNQEFVVDETTTKACPSCKVATFKPFGCDHMHCTMCDTHWCWKCKKIETSESIYDHLNAEHGGIGLDDFETEEEEQDDDLNAID